MPFVLQYQYNEISFSVTCINCCCIYVYFGMYKSSILFVAQKFAGLSKILIKDAATILNLVILIAWITQKAL